MIKVIDNFLSDSDFKDLQSFIMSVTFPWYYSPVLYPKDKDYNEYNNQYYHMFWMDDEDPKMTTSPIIFKKIVPVLKKLNVTEDLLTRIKLNAQPKKFFRTLGGYHNDSDNQTTSVYYLNTNNGGTKFKKSGKVVKSVENRIVIFDSNLIHSGIFCTNKPRRFVLNLNYYER